MNFTTCFEIINIIFFYTLLRSLIMKLMLCQDKGNHIVFNNDNDNASSYKIKCILDDNEILVDDKIEILDNLLDINSINRCYILYFIFIKQGLFYASRASGKPEAFNSYDEYIFWKNIYGGDKFNLDEHIYTDLLILNYANIKFISWVYYSGLYDYLMENPDIKKRILDEMNEKKLLCGHHFLRYILFITEYKTHEEEQDQEQEQHHIINDENITEENKDNLEDTLEDTLEDNLEDTLEDTLEDNEKELEKSQKYYNINDIDKYKFLSDLKQTTISLSTRIYNTIKAECIELFSGLFRNHLD